MIGKVIKNIFTEWKTGIEAIFTEFIISKTSFVLDLNDLTSLFHNMI